MWNFCSRCSSELCSHNNTSICCHDVSYVWVNIHQEQGAVDKNIGIDYLKGLHRKRQAIISKIFYGAPINLADTNESNRINEIIHL